MSCQNAYTSRGLVRVAICHYIKTLVGLDVYYLNARVCWLAHKLLRRPQQGVTNRGLVRVAICHYIKTSVGLDVYYLNAGVCWLAHKWLKEPSAGRKPTDQNISPAGFPQRRIKFLSHT